MIKNELLKNGIRILLEPVAGVDIISIGFWFLHGSRDELATEEGFSHFLEHMLFKGTDKRSTVQIAREIDRVGGGINAFTEKEVTCIYCTVPKEHFYLAVDVLCDIVFHSTIPAHELEREKIVIMNELGASDDAPEEKSFDLFFKQLWKDHPLAKKIIGSTQSLEKINRELLIAFYKQHFTKQNLIIAVSGDFDERKMLGVFEQLDGVCSGENLLNKRTTPQRVINKDFVADRFEQAYIYLGTYLRPARTIKDYYIQLILSTCFGESVSSRLFQEMREKQGLCYSISTNRIYFSDLGLWLIYANTFPELIPKLINGVYTELAGLFRTPLSKQEIEDAKCHIRGTLILSKPDLELRMKRIARQYIIMKELLTYEQSFALLDSITAAEVENEIRYLKNNAEYNLLVFGCKDVVKYRTYNFALEKAAT
ncbi:MAG: insulinase family protein [Spirochaetales bacterium]|nr:insulinase family protein [Spirochaetales bacterium]